MASPDPTLRYATDIFENVNGTQTDWEISFVGGYINDTDVYAFSGIVDPETDLLTDRVDHVVQIISEASDSSTVRIEPAVAAGRTLYIYRSTPVTQMLVQYTNGSIISKKNLDLSNDQLLKIIQEMFDALNINTLTVNQQIETVVDLNKIIQNIYTEVVELLASGGIVSVDPRTWAGAWVGDVSGDTDFAMPGADVTGSAFYDVYVNGFGLEPDVDYEVFVDVENTANSSIRFATVPALNSTWFAVLRGYAKPYTGPPPITATDLRVKIIEAAGPSFYADKAAEFGLIRCTYGAGTTVTVNAIPVVGDSETKLSAGSYFSIMQQEGVVNVVADTGVTLVIPAGCAAQTRGTNSTISLTCLDGDTNTWLLSGDLAKEA